MPVDDPEWNTFKFLESQSLLENKPDKVEDFAIRFKDLLTEKAVKHCKLANMGIGIHFTAYEEFDGHQIPEMFYISNISGIHPNSGFYDGVDDHFSMGRHSFHTLTHQPVLEEHRNPEFRLVMKTCLDSGFPIWFKNGDPLLFNFAAHALTQMTTVLSSRHLLNDAEDPVEFYSNLALQPVQIVSKLQSEFCKKDSAVVGGKCHQLTITPTGEFTSKTGKSDIGGFNLAKN